MRATKHHSYNIEVLNFVFFLSGGGKVGSSLFWLQVFVSIDSFPTGELTKSTFFLDQNCNCNWFPSLLQFCSLRQFVTIENMSDLLGVPLGYIYIYIVVQRMISVSNRSCLRNPTDLGPNRKWLWLYFMYPNRSSIWSRCAAWLFLDMIWGIFHVSVIGSIEIIEL